MNNAPVNQDQRAWKEISFENAIHTIEVPNFEAFFSFVNTTGSDRTDDQFLWRGQRRAEWEIISTLGRSSRASHQGMHFQNFVRAIARCTNLEYDLSNNNPEREKTEFKLWSLGQHWGLLTPLIDVTMYPYHALFFAFAESDQDNEGSRAVFALDGGKIGHMNFEITETQGHVPFREKLESPPYDEDFQNHLMQHYGLQENMRPLVLSGSLSDPVKNHIYKLHFQQEKRKELKLYSPSSNENRRIHSQGGLHIYTPNNVSVEAWVRQNHKINAKLGGAPILNKLLVPNKEREAILTSLNKMLLRHA